MIFLATLVGIVWFFVLFGAFNKTTRKQMFSRDSATCRDCGRKWDDGWMIEMHHILAIFEGGSDHPSNGVSLCRECHYKRHQQLAEKRKREGNKRGAEGHTTAANQIAYRIRTKGLKRYGKE